MFCDDCGKEITASWCNYHIDIENDDTEKRTSVSFMIKGEQYEPDTERMPKSKPIEHLCKTCAAALVNKAMKALKKEFEWDGKEE